MDLRQWWRTRAGRHAARCVTARLCVRRAVTRGLCQDVVIGAILTALVASGAVRWETWAQIMLMGSVGKTITDAVVSYAECARGTRPRL